LVEIVREVIPTCLTDWERVAALHSNGGSYPVRKPDSLREK
jgi:hypothetical protein